MVIQDQFLDPFIAVRGRKNEGVLQITLDLDRTGREGARMKPLEDLSGKEIQVASNEDMLKWTSRVIRSASDGRASSYIQRRMISFRTSRCRKLLIVIMILSPDP